MGSLAVLSEDFFSAYRDLLAKQKEALCKDFSLEGARSYENNARVLKEVVELRESKILLKALRDLRFGAVSSEGLASEEKGLYTSAIKLLREYEDSLVEPLPPVSEAQKLCEAPQLPAVSTVRILSDVPEAFVGVDGKEYGPYSAQEVVTLSAEQATLLVKRRVAEMVQQ